MNVLILSCGTRCKLVSYFMEEPGWDRVICTDCSKEAPALYFSDAYYIVPRFKEEGYFPAILTICEKESIDLIVPLQEEELLLISKNKEMFSDRGIFVAVSDYQSVLLCKDKFALNSFLEQNNVPAVPTYLANDYFITCAPQIAVFVKPRRGAGSVGTMRVNSKAFLKALLDESEEELVVQPLIDGEEYGIDVYVDAISHKVVSCFCKKKIRMRAGETEKSISVRIPELTELVTKAVTALSLIGPIDIDVFRWNGKFYVLEINPRFGGGYPHAWNCGISFPKYLLENTQGKSIADSVSDYKEGVMALT